MCKHVDALILHVAFLSRFPEEEIRAQMLFSLLADGLQRAQFVVG